MSPSSQVPEHAVVLMLENRSFDHMLGFLRREVPAIEGLTGGESNPLDVARPSADLVPVTDDASYTGDFTRPSPGKPVEVDPGHEHPDVNAQLYAAVGGQLPSSPNNLGFVDNYRRQKNSSADLAPHVMRCFAPDRVPALATLAREFAVCDHWYSSVPGPTWPNRLFAHAATSDGNVKHKKKLYGMHTVYEQLRARGLSTRIYAGDIAQSLLLRRLLFSGIFHGMDAFYSHIRRGKLGAYSFIEPDYFGGNATDQHPPHDVAAGERLIADVYEALRSSQYWERSVLVVVYDEHGGMYDHVPPPRAPNPDGKVSTSPPFGFDRLGVRVPAVVVSPWIARGKVDHTPYDHTSIITTLREWFQLGEPLTDRDAAATPFSHLIDLPAPRSDTPATLPRPPRSRARARALVPAGGAPLSDLQRQLVELADTVASVHQRAGMAAVRVRARVAAGEESARDYVQRVYGGQIAVSAALDADAPSRRGPRSVTQPKGGPKRAKKSKRPKKPKRSRKR